MDEFKELDGVLSRIGMHINPEIADSFGLKILIAGAVVTVLGHVMSRGADKK